MKHSGTRKKQECCDVN